MKKINLQFLDGTTVADCTLVAESLITYLVISNGKTYLVSKDALANVVVRGEDKIDSKIVEEQLSK